MADDDVVYRNEQELFMVDGQLVAHQTAYVHAYMKEDWYEIGHYYCKLCGQVWGLRVIPTAPAPIHFYHSSKCLDCDGEQDMLTPWEWAHLDVLGPNVLAYLILQMTEEVEDES